MVEFEDGFEIGDISKWSAKYESNGTVGVSDKNPKFGFKHLRCITADVVAQKRVYVNKLFPEALVKYVRGYFFWSPGPVVETQQRLSLIAIAGGTPVVALAIATIRGNHLISIHRHNGTSVTVDSGIELQPGQYYCIELGIKVGAGDGEVHIYLNGEEVFTAMALTNNDVGGALEARVGASFADADVAPQTVDVDQVAIGNSYIGPYTEAKPIPPPIQLWKALAVLGIGVATGVVVVAKK